LINTNTGQLEARGNDAFAPPPEASVGREAERSGTLIEGAQSAHPSPMDPRKAIVCPLGRPPASVAN